MDIEKLYRDKIEGQLQLAISLLKLEIQNKLEAQGHGKRETSRLINDIETEVETLAFASIAGLYMQDYYIFLERGVRASNIPFQRGSGRRTSKYIEGLKRFWRRKGLGPKESERAAFATANKHKKEGMPTRASFGFSKDGTRLSFLSSTIESFEERMIEVITNGVSKDVEIIFNMLFDNTIKSFPFDSSI